MTIKAIKFMKNNPVSVYSQKAAAEATYSRPSFEKIMKRSKKQELAIKNFAFI